MCPVCPVCVPAPPGVFFPVRSAFPELARSRLLEINFPKSPLGDRLQAMRVKTSVGARQRATGWGAVTIVRISPARALEIHHHLISPWRSGRVSSNAFSRSAETFFALIVWRHATHGARTLGARRAAASLGRYALVRPYAQWLDSASTRCHWF